MLVAILTAAVVVGIELMDLVGGDLSQDFFSAINWTVYNDSQEHYLAAAIKFTFKYLIFMAGFGATVCVAVIIVKWLTVCKFRQGSIRRYDLFVQIYQTYVMLSGMFLAYVWGVFASGTVWARLFYKLLGANISLSGGSHIMLCGYDHDLLEIGDGVVINEACGIMGHAYEHGCLLHKSVSLGANSCVYPTALVMAGDVVGEEATLGCMSKTFGTTPVPAGSMSMGCPAKAARVLEIAADDEAGCNAILAHSTGDSCCIDMPCFKSKLECRYEQLNSVASDPRVSSDGSSGFSDGEDLV